MKKNSIIRYVIVSISLVLVSILASFIITNFHVLSLDKSTRDIKEISLKNVIYEGLDNNDNKLLSNSEEKRYIKIKYSGYVNNLIINYKTKDNFYISINYDSKNHYNKNIIKNKTDGFNRVLNSSIIKINDNVKNITIDLSEGKSFYISSIKIDNSISFNYFIFLYILLILIAITILYLYVKCKFLKDKFEYLFLIISLLMGCLFILLSPYTTSSSWDDQIHYSSMYRIFEFDGITEWNLASHTMTEISPFISINTKEDRKLEDDYLNRSTNMVRTEKNSRLIQYNQVGYLIPGFIMKFCSLLGIPFILNIIFAKMSMLVAYSITIFFAIRIIPRGKRILAMIGLLPSSLFLATQFSYDPPIIAGIMLFVAIFINMIENNRSKMDLKTLIILLFSIIIPSFIKAIYIPLILLLLFIPSNKFKTFRQYKFFKIGIVMVLILMMSTFVLPTVSETSSLGDLRGGNTSTSGQIHNIISHPLGYIDVLNNTALSKFGNKLLGVETLNNFAYLQANEGIYLNNVNLILIILILFVIITDSTLEKKAYIDLKKMKYIKIFNVILIIGIILLIWTALYLSFTPVGEIVINGVQNRYFIPLLIPIILITFSNNKIQCKFNQSRYDAIIIMIIMIVLLYSIYNNLLIQFCL